MLTYITMDKWWDAFIISSYDLSESHFGSKVNIVASASIVTWDMTIVEGMGGKNELRQHLRDINLHKYLNKWIC